MELKTGIKDEIFMPHPGGWQVRTYSQGENHQPSSDTFQVSVFENVQEIKGLVYFLPSLLSLNNEQQSSITFTVKLPAWLCWAFHSRHWGIGLLFSHIRKHCATLAKFQVVTVSLRNISYLLTALPVSGKRGNGENCHDKPSLFSFLATPFSKISTYN